MLINSPTNVSEFSNQEKIRFLKFSKKIKKKYKYSDKFVELLWKRNIQNEKSLLKYKDIDISKVLNMYKDVFDNDKASDLIIKSISEKRHIIIYGDYDVDGITSVAILWRFLYFDLKYKKILPFLPDREKQGYGLNTDVIEDVIDKLKQKEKRNTQEIKVKNQEKYLLITVDCGIRDENKIKFLKEKYKNLKILVTDHHSFPKNNQLKNDKKKIKKNHKKDVQNSASDLIVNPVPNADALVHPFLEESNLEPQEICAAAVVWSLINCMKVKFLKKQSKNSKTERELNSYLLKNIELVALATVCDVMPLQGLNRDIVKLGLRQTKKTEILGLKALFQIAEKDIDYAKEYDFGFIIGPRINAVGRISHAIYALRLLCTNNPKIALKYAKKLNKINSKRQKITRDALNEVQKKIHKSKSERKLDKILILYNSKWAQGIVGLIAGEVQKQFHRPVIAFTQDKDNNWTGSARSNSKINITKLISKQEKFLTKYGGHAQAAGLTVRKEVFQDFKTEIIIDANKRIKNDDIEKTINIDGILYKKDLSIKFINELEILQPFGNKNPSPKFLFNGFKLINIRKFGSEKKHISIKTDYINDKGFGAEIIWFNYKLDNLNINVIKKYDYIGALSYNEWNGKFTFQLKVKHIIEKKYDKKNKKNKI